MLASTRLITAPQAPGCPRLGARRTRRPCSRQALQPRAFVPTTPAEGGKGAPASQPKKQDVDHVEWVLRELASPTQGKQRSKVVVAQVAPAVRVAIGEEFGMPAGAATTGKLVTALKQLGFDYVFDTLVGADLTIMEEGHELMERLNSHLHPSPDVPPAPLPMFSSCCPGWIEMMEKSWPELIPHVSSCKSPHMMVGSAVKRFFAQKIGRSPSDVLVVSIMPCLKKQGEADRIMMQTEEGDRECDHVLTTRELAKVVADKGWDYAQLPEADFDSFLGLGSGAAALFGTTGGVMEAALRTVYDLASGEQLPRLEWSEVRGLEGVKAASVTIPPNPSGPLKNPKPVTLNVAVANGLGNAKKLVKAVGDGSATFHFCEVMACPGGCIGGGGQPRSKDKEVLLKRQAGIYSVDERKTLRRSYESPVVQELYRDWLGEPGSHVAHAALHTWYEPSGPESFDINAPRPEPASAPLDEVQVTFDASSAPPSS